MITKKTDPVVNDRKYYVDLNEPQFKSVWRLMSLFQYAAKNDLNISKAQTTRTLNQMEKLTIDEVVKLMDKHMNKIAVFYWGEDNETVNTAEKILKPEPNTVASTQTALERNLQKRLKSI